MGEQQPEHHFERADVHEVHPYAHPDLPPGTRKLLLAIRLLDLPQAEVIDLNRNVYRMDDYRGKSAA